MLPFSVWLTLLVASLVRSGDAADDDDECDIDIPVNKAVPCAGAVLSVISYSIIFYLYYVKKLPTLKRHPTSLAINKSFFELLYVVQFLWVGFLDRDLYVDSADDCTASLFAGISAFVTQFSILGAELWFLVLTMDLHLAITNPFTSYKLNAFRYHFLVYGGSLGMAFALVIIAGNKVYGLSSDSSCWIQDTESRGDYNYPKVYFFYIFMTLIYAYCLYVVLFVFRRLKQGLSDTLTTRLSVVKRAQYYVLGYTFFWAFPLSLQFIDFIVKDSAPRLTHVVLQTTAVAFLASRGVFSLVILLLPNYTELKAMLSASTAASDKLAEKIVKEEANQNPHLNIALRAEILYFTTQGIRFAVASAESERQVLEKMQNMSPGDSKSASARARSLDALAGSAIADAVSAGELAERGGEDGASRGVNRIFSFGQLSRPVSMSPRGYDSGGGPVDHSVAIRELEALQRESISQDVMAEENKIRSRFSLPPMLRGLNKRTPSVDQNPAGSGRDRGNSTSSSVDGKSQESAEFRLNIESDGGRSNWARVSSATKTDSSGGIESSLKKTLESAVRTVPKDFTFKDYLPNLFAEVRSICNIDPEEYADSFLHTTKEKFSEGRSGAFLYFSSNLKYIVKTTTEDESEALRNIMEQYVDHIKKYPNSLICRFLGAHSLTLYGRKLFFVVMLNVFSGAEGFSERYDLKGSWVHRHGENTRRKSKSEKSAPLYKDNDLQFKISLLPGVDQAVTAQLARDTEFLRDLGLMDYSLLIGVVRRKYGVVDRGVDTPTELRKLGQDDNGAFHAATVEGPGSYHMGLIDILQEWNFEKKLERYFKVYARWDDPDGLSAIEPVTYQKRFMERAVYEVFEGQDAEDSGSARNSSSEEPTPAPSKMKKNVDRRFSVTPISTPTSASQRNTFMEVQSPLMENESHEDDTRHRAPSHLNDL